MTKLPEMQMQLNIFYSALKGKFGVQGHTNYRAHWAHVQAGGCLNFLVDFKTLLWK